MCNRALTWAYEQDLPPIDKFVLVTIANMVNRKTNACWPSQATLAKLCGICRQRVNKALANLRRMGLVLIEKRVRSRTYTLPPLPAAHVAEDDISLNVSPTTTHDMSPTTTPPPHMSLTTTSDVAHGDTEPLKEPLVEPEEIPPPIVPPPPAGRGKKAKREFPADWQPDEQDIQHAWEKGRSLDWIDHEGRHCRDHHLAKGNVFADLHAAWRTWVHNAEKFELRKDRSHGKQNAHDAETAAFEFASRGFAI